MKVCIERRTWIRLSFLERCFYWRTRSIKHRNKSPSISPISYRFEMRKMKWKLLLFHILRIAAHKWIENFSNRFSIINRRNRTQEINFIFILLVWVVASCTISCKKQI